VIEFDHHSQIVKLCPALQENDQQPQRRDLLGQQVR
jgi:hypothetical protein